MSMHKSWFATLNRRDRAKRRLRWLFSKWSLAELFNKSKRTCWADLVDWALHKNGEYPDEDESYMLRYRVSGGKRCLKDSTDLEMRSCYCGKFVDGGIRPKNWTPEDAS